MQYFTGATTGLVGNGRISGTVLSDPLTSGGAWTSQSGTETYSGSGVTFTSAGTFLDSANATSAPIAGIPITAQVTFQTPSTGTPLNMKVSLWQDASNSYELRWQNDNNLVLYKTIAGTTTAPSSSGGTPTEAGATAYTFTLSLDSLGNLTGSLYSGSGTGGTLLKQLTATDTSLLGPFHIGVGGDANVVASNAVFTGPIANPNLSSKPVEIKIPLWASDGVNTITTSTAWVYLADGGSTVSSATSSNAQLHTLSSKWLTGTKFALEATIWQPNGANTNVQLYDATSSAAISSSYLSSTSTTATVMRSGQFTLTSGHTHAVQVSTSNASYAAQICDVSLIVFP